MNNKGITEFNFVVTIEIFLTRYSIARFNGAMKVIDKNYLSEYDFYCIIQWRETIFESILRAWKITMYMIYRLFSVDVLLLM